MDEECLTAFGDYVVGHYDFKKQMQGFMKEKMDFITPNLTALIGESVTFDFLKIANFCRWVLSC